MALVCWIFFRYLFSGWVLPETAQEYIADMILLDAASCTAMLFVWSQLVKGDPSYTLVQVSVNDIIMLFVFTPIVVFLLNVSDVAIPWATLILSTVLYVLLPLLAGVVTQVITETGKIGRQLRSASETLCRCRIGFNGFTAVRFAGTNLNERPFRIVLIAVPLLLPTYGIFFLERLLAKFLRLPCEIAGPAYLIGTSNFFEQAVAVAVSLFGLHSGAALATVVGVLVEVPVMLSLVA